jgi:ATP-dependent Clp protease ATP-binding subunit ClpA
MLFPNGVFSPAAVGDARAADVLHRAADRARILVRPSDILAAALAAGDAKVRASLAQVLDPGASPADLAEVIEAYNPARDTPPDFDGRRERFAPESLAALDRFAAELQEGSDALRAVALEALLACVLGSLDGEDREFLTILNADAGATLFREQVRLAAEPLTPLFESESGRLRSEEFTESAWAALEGAATRAAELGYDRLLPPHVFLALVGETEGVAEHLVRLQATPDVGPGKVLAAAADAFRLSDRRGEPPTLSRDGIGEATVVLFRGAQRVARLWNADRVDSPHLLAALLDDMPPRLAGVLRRPPLDLDLEKLRTHLQQALREARTRARREVPFRLAAGLLPSEDLTFRARTDTIGPAIGLDPYFDAMLRALYRRANHHVLITGQRGIGKTTLVRELARRAAAGEIPFLSRKRFLWVDAGDVSPADSGAKLAAILAHVTGRTDLILCLDGLGPLLRGEPGTTHKLALRAALKERRIQLVAVMADRDFEDLLSADRELVEFFTRIGVAEPDRETALAIVSQAAAAIATEFKVSITAGAIDRSVVLSADYILNERLPSKAIRILRRVCEDLDYERTQRGGARATIEAEDVIRVVSEVSGVPESTLSGITEEADYDRDLAGMVVGQPEAVAAVATELRLIKAGLTDPGKPASVMMFAGLTGVGKTELAKTLARFYSSSKRLQTYTMGNFTESHAVSGIIGVPPGYVGHEQGGRIVNDLNTDPYGVFLLDEAEKAHPDIWKPFLNLFDEGWIVDQRAVKAFGDRAIFILTSNAGADVIASLSRAGEPMERIIEAVKTALLELRHPRSGEVVFAPEFLARIRRIIVFKPLDRAAMEGICRKIVGRMQTDWERKRNKTIVVPDALIAFIAERSHAENERSGGKEGGRIVAKLSSEHIEVPIQREAQYHRDEFKSCRRIELVFLPPGPARPFLPPPEARVDVRFLGEAAPVASTV